MRRARAAVPRAPRARTAASSAASSSTGHLFRLPTSDFRLGRLRRRTSHASRASHGAGEAKAPRRRRVWRMPSPVRSARTRKRRVRVRRNRPRARRFFSRRAAARRETRHLFFASTWAESDPEKVQGAEARARRARLTAHALGMGPPVARYAARDRREFPWTRGWRDGSRMDVVEVAAGPWRDGAGLPEVDAARRDAAETRHGRRERKRKRRRVLAGVLPGGRFLCVLCCALASLESGGAVARDRLFYMPPSREAFSGAETRRRRSAWRRRRR